LRDTILVVYESGRKYERAFIDLQTFQVDGVEEVSIPELR
jgi:hypothetical protein